MSTLLLLLGRLRTRLKGDFREEDHPRGQPGNAGQFGPGGSGSAAQHPLGEGVQGDKPLSADREAALDKAARGRAGKILDAVAGLPARLAPGRLKRIATKVRVAVVGFLERRYGERGAGLILKAAALSAPVPVPGSQPVTIAVSLVVAEAVRALGKLRRKDADGELTADEIHGAAVKLLGRVARLVGRRLGGGDKSLSILIEDLRARLKETDASGHEHKPAGPGGGQFTGHGGGGGGEDRDKEEEEPAEGLPKKPAVRKGTPSKQMRAAGRFVNVARRRRVVAAVKVEGELAEALHGYNLPDSEPADVVYAEDARGKRVTGREALRTVLAHRELAVKTLESPAATDEQRTAAEAQLALPCHFFEVKTLLVSSEGAVRMSKQARRRKERWRDRYGADFHVVAVDRRKGQKHSGHEVHLAAGELAGTFRLDRMDRVDGFGAVLSAVCPSCAGAGKG